MYTSNIKEAVSFLVYVYIIFFRVYISVFLDDILDCHSKYESMQNLTKIGCLEVSINSIT